MREREQKEGRVFFLGAIMTSLSFLFSFSFSFSFSCCLLSLLSFVLSSGRKARKATRGGGGEDGRRRELYDATF